jgi:hypothetical protein
VITLPPAITTSGTYQSPSPQSSDVNEIIVTEMLVTISLKSSSSLSMLNYRYRIYTTVSTCPVTTDTSVFSGLTSYYVTNTVSTLTLTATTTVPCQNCHPQFATAIVMLIGASPTDSTGNAAVIPKHLSCRSLLLISLQQMAQAKPAVPVAAAR